MSQRLTQKERQLLNDQLNHEKICIEKYTNYSQQVSDPQLSQLLNQYASQEQQHYDTITQLLQGQQPSMSAQSSTGGGTSANAASNRASSSGHGSGGYAQAHASLQMNAGTSTGQAGTSGSTHSARANNDGDDALMLTDMLMTEKFISNAYDTAIFESATPAVRQALQHIQDEEQQHGEGLYNYMSQNGMYQTS
jgi:spore coat protein CotF